MIAAYFAVEDCLYGHPGEPEDAAVWILEPHVLNELEGFGKHTPPMEAHVCGPMLRPAFTDRDTPENGRVLCAMAAEKDVRMFVQEGCFTIHSDQLPLNRRQGGRLI